MKSVNIRGEVWNCPDEPGEEATVSQIIRVQGNKIVIEDLDLKKVLDMTTVDQLSKLGYMPIPEGRKSEEVSGNIYLVQKYNIENNLLDPRKFNGNANYLVQNLVNGTSMLVAEVKPSEVLSRQINVMVEKLQADVKKAEELKERQNLAREEAKKQRALEKARRLLLESGESL